MHAWTSQAWISEAFRWQHGLEDSASNCTGISGDSPLGYELGLPQECLTHLDALYKVLAQFMDHLRVLREIDIGCPEERILACWHAQQLLSMDFPQHGQACRYSQARGVLPAKQLTADEAFPAGFSVAATYRRPKWLPEPPPPPKRPLALVPKGQLQPVRPLTFRMPGTLQQQTEPSSAQDKTLMISTQRPPGYPSWAKWFGVDPTQQPKKKL